MKAKSFAHKVISYGPGGYLCPCCGPRPGGRRKERQHNRRVFNRLLDDIEREEEKHKHIDCFMFPEFEHRESDWITWDNWCAQQDTGE